MIALAAIVVSLFAVAGAQAANFTVTTTNDTNDGSCTPANCSLRDAVIAANGAAGDDTISVPAGHYLLTIAGSGENAAATGDLDILNNGALTITGAGARSTIIDATALGDRVFEVQPGATATISGATVTGGNVAADGGGIRNAGTLTVTDSTVQGNADTGNNDGGGIWTGDTSVSLTVTGSTISGNSTDEYGGGLDLDAGAVSVTNTTISGNVSTGNVAAGPDNSDGGGVDLDTGKNVQFTNDTIANNASNNPATSGGGGGVWDNGKSNVFFQNTIVANNTASNPGANCDKVQPASASNPGNNLDSDSSCFAGPNDTHADPLLGPLQNNGGPTDTQALGSGSPALDAGDNTVCPSTDQRGVVRPQGAGCDIGAFEAAVAEDLGITKAAPSVIAAGANIPYTLTVTDNGPGRGTGVTVTDPLPAGTSFVSATPSQGSCSGTTTVICSLGVVNKGATPTVTIVVKSTTPGTVTNTARVSGNEADPNSANNSASAGTSVAGPPAVVTGAAGAITQTGATLTGSVNDANLPATYVFQYGLTNTYGLKTTNTALRAGPGAQAVNAAIGGLQAGKTYHYRLVAVSAAGSTNGADMTFTTRSGARGAPRAVTTHVTPRHAHSVPYRYTFTGRLVLPSGVTPSQGCKGSVTIRIKAGKRTVFNRRAGISSKCTYRLRVSFGQPSRLGTSGRLRVTVRFPGNAVLSKKSPRSFTVFFG